MKTFHLWLVMLLLCSITACKKEKALEPATLETTVYGRIVLHGTDQKATNQPCVIKAYWNTPTDILGGSITRLIAETTTDSNGYYNLQFTAADFDKDGYFIKLETDIENHFSPKARQHNIKPGQKQELQLRYTPHAWLRLHVRNTNPVPLDEFTVNWGSGESYKFWGPANSQIVLLGAGNSTNIIYYNLKRSGVHYPDTTHIHLSAFDTTYHLIEY